MVQRQTIIGFIADLQAARVRGDVNALLALFDDEATFRIVGLGSPAAGKTAVRAALTNLIETFEFIEFRSVATVVEGHAIAMRCQLQVRHRPSGREMKTETSDFLTMRDGRCATYVQFIDTAAVIRLVGR